MRIPSILRALKPVRSQAQHFLEQGVGSEVDPALREALAVKTALEGYLQPQDRRTFFKNALGLPHRGAQIARAKALIADELGGNEVGGELGLMTESLGIEGMEDLARFVQENPPAQYLLERAQTLQRGSDPTRFEWTPELEDEMQMRIKETVLPEEVSPEPPNRIEALRTALSTRFGRRR